MIPSIIFAGMLVSPIPFQPGGGWPGILGPNGDLASSQPIEFQFSASGLQTIWKKPVGTGYSGPVSLGGVVVLFHRIGNQEFVEAYLLKNGEKKWSTNWEANYSDDYGKGDGPRATPLIVDGLVIVHSPDGVLRALDFESGKLRWKNDVAGSIQSKRPFFGFGASPASIDGVLVLNAGGDGAGIVGILPGNGEIIWRQTSHPSGYSTAIGIDQGNAAVFTRNGIVILKAKTGELIFEKRWRSRIDASVNAASPLRWKEGIFFSSSYGTGCVALRFHEGTWKEVWSGDQSLSSHFATPVCVNGLILGFHGRQEVGTELRCIDPESGKLHWKKEGVGAGWLGVSGSYVVLLREDGNLSVFRPSAKGMQEIGSGQALKAPCWSPCALADGVLLARDGSELKAIRLGKTLSNP